MKIKNLIFVVLSVLLITDLRADDNDNNEDYLFQTLDPTDDHQIRRSPSRSTVVGIYSDGNIFFNFRTDVGYVACVVEQTETMEKWENSFDSVEGCGSIHITNQPGTYSICLYTENGLYRSVLVIK